MPVEDLALGLLLAAITVYLAFNAGGFFPKSHAFAGTVMGVLLALRIALARKPFAGLGPWLTVGAVVVLLLAVWQALSGAWSNAPGRAIVEADRTTLYLLTLLFFGSFGGRPERMRWLLRGLLMAIVIVCAVGLATRLAPDQFPIPANLGEERLSYPLTYWNALGFLALLGILLGVYLTTSVRIDRRTGIGRAVIPGLSATLLLTFSRGAIGVAVLGLAVYLVVAHPRGILGLVPPAIATAVGLQATYGADLLASQTPTATAAAAQGHQVAVTLAICTLGAFIGRLGVGLLIPPCPPAPHASREANRPRKRRRDKRDPGVGHIRGSRPPERGRAAIRSLRRGGAGRHGRMTRGHA